MKGFNEWPEEDPVGPLEEEPEPEPVAEPEQNFAAEAEVRLTALYDYEKDEEDELSFCEGDEIIKLSEPSDEGTFPLFLN